MSVRNLIQFLCAAAAIMLAAAALTFVVDPLQLFRPATFYKPMYSNDSRMQDAALIRNQPFDTVFMGTSLAIHFRQSDIDRIVGGRSLKLAMSGSTSREQSFVLAAALARHPKRVIWQIDDWIFRDAPDVDADVYLPADLYRRNPRGIASYLLSGAMARESAWTLVRTLALPAPLAAKASTGVLFKFVIPNVNDINVLAPSVDIDAAYNARQAMAGYESAMRPQRRLYLGKGYDYEAMVRNFERDAVALIRANPEVRFDLYFAPYSILNFVTLRDGSPATLKTVYDLTAYMAQRLTALPNVRLYDFRVAKEITHDLGNYSDVVHHAPKVDLQVLSWLAAGTFAIDPDVPLASLEALKRQVEAYRLAPSSAQ